MRESQIEKLMASFEEKFSASFPDMDFSKSTEFGRFYSNWITDNTFLIYFTREIVKTLPKREVDEPTPSATVVDNFQHPGISCELDRSFPIGTKLFLRPCSCGGGE